VSGYAGLETLAVDASGVAEEGILRVRLDRPEKRNAISTAMRRDISTVLDRASRDDDVRVVVLAANGPSFSAGNDLTDMGWSRDPDAMSIFEHVQRRPNLFEAVWDCSRPVVAAVHSHCLGAAIELVSACDMVVCADDARFGWPELRGGAIAPSIWPATMPINRVKEYLITGRLFDADEALRVGVVNRVVPRDELDACIEELARNIATTATGYAPLAKAGINQVYEWRGVRQTIQYARQLNVISLQSAGSAAFWEEARQSGRAATTKLAPGPDAEYWTHGRS
jgi:enoyl-CoA hydratase/carnithine racemase